MLAGGRGTELARSHEQTADAAVRIIPISVTTSSINLRTMRFFSRTSGWRSNS
jgi:hypothetical protein